jgi:hypothetical protein
MKLAFDMQRLHPDCGESLKINPCMLLGISRQVEQVDQPVYGLVFSDRDVLGIYWVTQTAERHWG